MLFNFHYLCSKSVIDNIISGDKSFKCYWNSEIITVTGHSEIITVTGHSEIITVTGHSEIVSLSLDILR